MEELALLIADIVEDWVFDDAMLALSTLDELITELAYDMELEEDMDSIISSFDTFKSWSTTNLPSVSNILNGIVGLQLVYNLIVSHAKDAATAHRTISVEQALGDIEGTLVKNFADLRQKAQALLEKPGLTEASKASLRATVGMSPAQYWDSSKLPIMLSLEKLPIYT